MKQLAVALIGVGSILGLASSAGCTRSHDVGVGAQASGQILPIELDDSCLEEIADSVNSLPKRLSCTGLYSDIGKREVAMPWKESSVMDERLRFIARLLEGEAMGIEPTTFRLRT